jgi:serine phosphatase RsbU (regulator of sigma subunit)
VVDCEEGVADLTPVNFQNDFARLNGEWEFYYNAYYSPKELDKMLPETFGEVPGFWKHYPGDYPKLGYATYKLTFKLTKTQLLTPLSLRINNIHNAYKIWLNGELLSQVGELGESYESSVPRWLPQNLKLENLQEENEIVLQVCNFRHRNGGVQDAFEIGSTASFTTQYQHQFFSEVFLSGAAIVLGCFFIGMFFFWKKDRAALHFGVFSIFFGLRVILIGTRSAAFSFPDLSWDFLVRLEYIGMFAMHFFMFHFVYHAFTEQTNKKYLTVLRALTAVYVVICLIPGDFFTYTTIPNNYYLLATFFYCLYIFVRAMKENVPGAIWAILGIALFFVTTIPMILEYSNLFIADPVILSISYIAFMLSMSLIFAARFGFSFSYLESLKNSEELKKQEIIRQKENIERNNSLIHESITYAQGIQQSMLPTDIDLRNVFGECFVFFKPEGKVSGDFYWSKQRKDAKEALIAVADCTGHGVPGAFISLIAISALDNLVERKDHVETDLLVAELNEVMHDRLKRSYEKGRVMKEGLDIGICKINYEDRTVWFSAAHHKLLVVKNNGEYLIYQGDNHHLGMPVSFDFSFAKHEIQLEEGDQFYLFTDGVYDQKGGGEGKKLYLKRFVEVVVKNRELPMHRQKIEFEEFMQTWMEGRNQMDDMLMFGMRL